MKTLLLVSFAFLLSACGREGCSEISGTWKRYTGEVISVSGCTIHSETYNVDIQITGDRERLNGDAYLVVSQESESLDSLPVGTHDCLYSYNYYESSPPSISFQCKGKIDVTYQESK